MGNLTQARLRELLDYDPETGFFTWLSAPNGRIRVGQRAGSIWHGRYLVIRVDGCQYGAHRLAFLYMTGEWPPYEIDHRDTDGLNNSWKNIRAATVAQNGANRRINVNNTSGFKGVTIRKFRRPYRAYIVVHGKNHHLGYFDTAEEAHAAYSEAAKNHFGEFARAT